MQITRLFEIVYLLLRRESIPAGELAEHFEVSTRTIYRDIDLLSAVGIPVYAARGKYGGIRLLPEFVLNRSWFSAGEQENILAAVQSLSAANLPEADDVLRKLAGLFRQSADAPGWVAIDFSDWSKQSSEKIELLKAAVLQRRVIEFDYYNSQNQRTHRSAEPIQLWFKHRAWYLRAYCLQREAYRLFKLTRMREVALSDLPCTHPAVFEELEQTAAHAPVAQLVVRIAARQAYRVYDEFEEEQITQNPDGSFTVTCKFIEDSWLYGYLMTFGPDAEVLSPEHVRQGFIEKIQKMSATYIKPDTQMS